MTGRVLWKMSDVRDDVMEDIREEVLVGVVVVSDI